ncbi:MAG TPA: efflux RND transporter periplasmic adaptor subunit [Bryobacteraceae bacterium]|nr:efflux RND transporter periplasmic adaptor subunit [Bryobacteraceae bacterium]
MSVAASRDDAPLWFLLLAIVFSTACGKVSHPPTAHAATVTAPAGRIALPGQRDRQFRLNGTVHAVRVFAVQVPQITGQGGRITLTRLVANGSKVQKGDLLVEFDRTQQLDNARDAQAKFDDLSHQVDQKRAQNRSDEEKRSSDLQKAEADLERARIQLRKGQLLSEIDRLKNEAKLEDAEAHVASLRKSNRFHDLAGAAALRILELQRDRQKVQLERALSNAARLQLHAPLAGMVALENVWRNGSMGHAQEGDQLWSGQVLLRIFDPSEMSIHALVGEPDGALLSPGKQVKVRLDAYPDLLFPARFEAASPVASSALGSPIKTFAARFRLEVSDPHLLPDLSAAVILEPETP